MKCVDRVRRLAESVGGSLDLNEDSQMIVDAPVGYVWASNGASIICAPCANYNQTWYEQACRQLISEMSEGLQLADTDEIATISRLRDEPWQAPDGSPEFIDVKYG